MMRSGIHTVRERLTAVAVAVVVLVISAIGVTVALEQRRSDHNTHVIRADAAAVEARHAVAQPITGMLALQSFLTANPNVRQDQLADYTLWALTDTGLEAVSYYASVNRNGVFGSPVLASTPRGAPITPSAAPVAQAIQRSIATGRPAMSAPLPALTGPPTVAIVTAVYRDSVVPVTQVGRERLIRGVAIAQVTMETLMDAITAGAPPGTTLQISDGGVAVAGHPGGGSPIARTVSVGDRLWTVSTWAPPSRRPLWTALAACLAGLIAGGVAWRSLNQAHKRERYAGLRVTEAMETRDRIEAELRGSEERFRVLVSNAPTGIFQLAADGSMVFANETWRTLAGLTEDQATGHNWVRSIHPDDLAQLSEWKDDAAAGRASQRPFRFVTPGGRVRWVVSVTSALRDETGEPVGWIGSVSDVTDRTLAEERLAASDQLHRAVIDGAADAIITTDAAGVIQSVNPASEAVFGHPPDTLVGHHVGRVLPHIEAPQPSPGARVEGRHANGETVQVHLAISETHAGNDVRFTAIARDLTREIAAENAIRLHAREQTALREVATLVAAQAPSAAVGRLAAQQVRELDGCEVAGVIRFDGDTQAVVSAIAGDPPPPHPATDDVIPVGLDTPLARVRARGITVHADVAPMALGDLHLRRAAAAPIVIDGTVWGALIVGNHTDAPLGDDVDDRLTHFASLVALAVAADQARDTLARLAATDHLTDLPNRRTFNERLDNEVVRATRHARPLSLMLLDIDHFKAINDTHGHEVGDRVLREVAQRLGSQVRRGEMLSRIGGEEFAWLLPESDPEAAMRVAERARRAVAAAPFHGVGRVTASLGICSMSNATDAGALFRRADAALYRAKSEGRDRAVCYDPRHDRDAERASGNVVPLRPHDARERTGE